MTPEKYNRIKDIFLAALDKPAQEQREFLDRQSAGDDEIRREVESLLREHQRKVQVMPSEPENPFGSMSAILSHANIDLGKQGADKSGGGDDKDHPIPEGKEITDESSTDSLSGFVDAGRFMAGTMAAGRYRIIELLGRGGMGEVYRADDTMLNQSVALKFLPALFGSDQKWLERFREEVRLARQVTHPNVCRVFDIGEFQGEQFISMEYVDGENLASLIRRIGRLPQDKALQIARQLCAGLAAAHDRGVLHRDLKPANVMIDGRGAVRITDFGLAAPVDQMRKDAAAGGPGGPLRAGTPAYMSPEQLAGKSVTVRSDIYSLGLLLYEMFTGRRAFKGATVRDYVRLHSSEEPTTPSEIVEDIDPIVERVILRCLEKDPKNRPASAMAVSAGLPGGDPLREILAAGETPSPEVVAAAGEAQGGLRPHVATLFLVTGLLSILAAVLLAPSAFLIQKALKPQPPAFLPANTDSAIKILQRLGYTDIPRDRAHGFSLNLPYYTYIQNTQKTPDRWKFLLPPNATSPETEPQPAIRLVYFWYRQSPDLMVPQKPDLGIQEDDPPMHEPAPRLPTSSHSGMIRLRLDPQGTLIGLEAEPSQPPASPSRKGEESSAPRPSGAPHETDWWEKVLEEANLNAAELKPVLPVGPLPVYANSNTRIAWDGILDGTPVHVEAAEYQGRPVYFSISGPWDDPKFSGIKTERQSRGSVNVYVQTILSLCLLSAGCFLAWRNYRSGRGDRAGAMRMALAFFVFGFIAWLLHAHHVPDILQEFSQFQRSVGPILYPVCMVWIFYLALEPYVRRVWPETIISWSRLLSGKWFDPLVGRDILIGAVAGSLTMVLQALDMLVPRWLGLPAPMPTILYSNRMLVAAENVSVLFSGAISALYLALILLLLLVLMRMALRKKWVFAVTFILVFVAATARWGANPDYGSYLTQAIIATLFLGVLIRYGLVALIFCVLVRNLLSEFPISPDFSVWYATTAFAGLGASLVILIASFYAALGGRSPIPDLER